VGDILALADRLWRGETDTTAHHPLSSGGELTAVADDVACVASTMAKGIFGWAADESRRHTP